MFDSINSGLVLDLRECWVEGVTTYRVGAGHICVGAEFCALLYFQNNQS